MAILAVFCDNRACVALDSTGLGKPSSPANRISEQLVLRPRPLAKLYLPQIYEFPCTFY